MTDDEMALEAAKHFEWCETVELTRELESMLKQIQTLVMARVEWVEHRKSKCKSEQELSNQQADILRRWNKLRREIAPMLDVACKDATKHRVDDLTFHTLKRLVREGRLDSKLFDAAESGLNEIERLESRNLDRLDSNTIVGQCVEQTKAQDSEPMSELDSLEESLSGQRLKLLRFLRSRKHWINYETLGDADGIWGVESPSDATIAKAIKRLNVSLLDSSHTIETSDRRVKLMCLNVDKQRDNSVP